MRKVVEAALIICMSILFVGCSDGETAKNEKVSVAAVEASEEVTETKEEAEMRRQKLLNEHFKSLEGNSEQYGFDQIELMDDSPLKDKKVVFLGSSVTLGFASTEKSLPEYFAARTGCVSVKEAVGGTTLVDTGEDSYVARMKSNLDPDESYDLFICQLSTNDATQKLPLGEVSEGTELEDFDTSTITGAMEYIICYVQQTWQCPVLFYTGSYYEDENYEAMVKQLEALKDKWNIGILDLWNNEEFNNISDEQRELYMNDKVHPTMAGYRDWWCPELEHQLFDYLNKNK